MRTIRLHADSLSPLPDACSGAAVAIGNFDGVHIGHQRVLAQTRALASAHGVKPAVLTFYPHPREFFDPALTPLSIYTLPRKLSRLREEGMELVYVLRFDAALARLSAGEFIQQVLADTLRAVHVVTGENFTFGHKRGGTAEFLASVGKKLGIGASAVDSVHCGRKQHCSSSRIRELLERGEMPEAAELLGRPYTISGRVRHGDKRGRELGFPTANIGIERIFHPASGVYAVRARIDGKWHEGVANLGIRPTVGGVLPQLEVHCFDLSADLYGKMLHVQLLQRLREERRFTSIDVLRQQIFQDCMQARAITAGVN